MSRKIITIDIVNEMKSSYIDYSMSVIISRALPDVRDGLKPVHRRVLYGMYKLNVLSNSPYKKSARIVGEVLGKFHPHGDRSVYDAIVRMAQDWSLLHPLIDGQGNFGSLDNDPPAAMRYTEIRLSNFSEDMLVDIEKETVDMQLNFDDSIEEPSVLPTRIPNLLINGSSGIAVGLATNMAPHNLKESIEAICAYIDNKNICIDELITYIKAPDFPTGGIIYGYQGVKEAFHVGKGRIILRASVHFEKIQGRKCLIVDEIPYLVNKEDMIEKTKNIVKEGKIENLSQIRDESDRRGIRIVYMLKQGTEPQIILNKLYKYTDLQTSFCVNNIALVKRKPVQLNLKDIIKYFVDHRNDVIIRRSSHDLSNAKERLHVLRGFIIALDSFDTVFQLVRNSKTPKDALEKLTKEFNFSEIQVRSILEMRLHRFTSLEKNKIRSEYEEVKKTIEKLNKLLNQEILRLQLIKRELIEIKEKYIDKRRTEIDYSVIEVTKEYDIPGVLTISNKGYIKRTPLSAYNSQSRGGIVNIGAGSNEKDFMEHLLVAQNRPYMLLFTKKGKCFWLRVFEIPESARTSKGGAIQNLIELDRDDQVKAYILSVNLKNFDYINSHYVILVTEKGILKRTPLKSYSHPRKRGIQATIIRPGDSLIEAKLTTGNSDILIAIRSGKSIRFPEKKIRVTGRKSYGVKSISLAEEKDSVIGVVCVQNREKENILVVSENGYGKRSNLGYYRITDRIGKGIKTINITEKTGKLIAINNVTDKNYLMIINKSGITIRIPVSGISFMGRNTQGIRLINLKKDKIAAVVRYQMDTVCERSL
jgi:DNA gyrase subunit A